MSDAKSTPGPWWYDTYNTIFSGSGESVKAICSIPDHPQDGEYLPEQSAERSAWYAESQANAYLICTIPDVCSDRDKWRARAERLEEEAKRDIQNLLQILQSHQENTDEWLESDDASVVQEIAWRRQITLGPRNMRAALKENKC